MSKTIKFSQEDLGRTPVTVERGEGENGDVIRLPESNQPIKVSVEDGQLCAEVDDQSHDSLVRFLNRHQIKYDNK